MINDRRLDYGASLSSITNIGKKKTPENIKLLLNEKLKYSRFIIKKYNDVDCLFYNDAIDRAINGIKPYIKIYIKNGLVTILGWVTVGKKIYALSDNFQETIYLKNFSLNRKKLVI